MAGIFGMFNNQAKPGKGVDKNAPKKHRFFVFFELLFRKIWKLITLNLVYFFLTFPLFASIMIFVLGAAGVDAALLGNDMLTSTYGWFFSLPSFVVWPLIIISVIIFGPVTAGVTYIIRNFVREEHAWVWSDLFERSKENFKQGLVAGIVDILLIISFVLYLTMQITESTQYMSVLRYVAIAVFAVYQIMRFYIYTIMVTFDMKFTSILKNAWLFVFLGIVRNFIIIVFAGGILCFTVLSRFNFLFVPLITFTLTGFIVVFNSYPTIKKFMIDPLTERDEDSDIEIEYVDEDDEPIFEDDVAVRNRQALEASESEEK